MIWESSDYETALFLDIVKGYVHMGPFENASGSVTKMESMGGYFIYGNNRVICLLSSQIKRINSIRTVTDTLQCKRHSGDTAFC